MLVRAHLSSLLHSVCVTSFSSANSFPSPPSSRPLQAMANTKKAKITIKPFRHQVTMDAGYADTTWALLSNAIHEIHKKNASGLSFEELYRYGSFGDRN